MKNHYLLIFIFTACLAFSELSFALQAIVVKGNRVLLSLDKSEVGQINVNSLIVADDRVTQVKIIQVRGVRAVGQVISGSAKVNQNFRTLAGEKKTGLAQSGFMAGFSSNSMSIALTASTTFKMSGTGFSIVGLYDYPFFSDFSFRGMAGYETFKAEGSLSTCPSGKCTVSLNYLTAHGYAQYDITKFGGGSRIWLGLGAGFLFLSSGSSEIIDTKSMSTNQIAILAGGMDFALSDGKSIPVQIDYFLYPDGDIKTQQINVRLGYKF